MKSDEVEKKRKEKKLFTLAEFADLIGKTSKTVGVFADDGIVKTELIGNKRFVNVGNSLLSLYKYYEAKANSKDEKKDREKLRNDLIEATIEYRKTSTELQNIKKDIQTGRYIDTSKVKESNSKFLTIFKNFALSLPSQMIGMIGAKIEKSVEREVQANLEIGIKKLLNDFIENGRLEEEQIESGLIELNEKGNEKKQRGRKKRI